MEMGIHMSILFVNDQPWFGISEVKNTINVSQFCASLEFIMSTL